MTMSLRFWGVRGSVASPGPDTVQVGGNTPCVEINTPETRLVLDAGTGLRLLGNTLLGKGAVDITLLLSHLHWDHIQGLPFFTPLYIPGTRVRIVAGANGRPVRETLRSHMSPPTFPIDLDQVPAALEFLEVRDRQSFTVGDVHVRVARANHPDPVYAYRLEHEGQVVVYATDTEHYSCVDPGLAALARDADILIYDAQYLPEEYSGEKGMSRVGWGHSTYEAGVRLALEAQVAQLLLFHHDPARTDEAVRQLEARARSLFANTRAAREGMTLILENRVSACAA